MDTCRAWAEVDLDALGSNLAWLRAQLPRSVSILLVAKANAYGHGSIAVAHHAQACGVDALGVTTCAEALELRSSGVRARLLVLGPVLGGEVAAGIRHRVEFAIPSPEVLRRVEEAAEAAGSPARVHVKVDTGMGRLGVPPLLAPELLEQVHASPRLELAGIMTHFAEADHSPSPRTRGQVEAFEAVLAEARRRGLLRGGGLWIHAANSAAVLAGDVPVYDAVRVGLAAFGISPVEGRWGEALAPVLAFRTQVVHLSELAPGDRVGYGGTWEARRPSRVAVLPVGYDDGVSWRLSNRGHVLLRGQRAPIVGRVSMDYTTVDVTDLPGVRLGDRATLVGRDGDAVLRVEELAQTAGTIPYEVLCSIGRRVERTYTAATLFPMAAPGATGAPGERGTSPTPRPDPPLAARG